MNKARRKELGEAMDLLIKIKDDFESAKSLIQTAGEAEREYYDNMSENLQGGERGEQADNAATILESATSSLDEVDLDDLISKINEARGTD